MTLSLFLYLPLLLLTVFHRPPTMTIYALCFSFDYALSVVLKGLYDLQHN